jgi:hypothetical protein
MRHPADGVLRRLLDEPAGVPDADRAHVADCTVCLDGLARAADDAAAARTALTVAGPAPDVDRAWSRLAAPGRAAVATPAVEPAPARTRGWRTAVRRPLVAALGAVVVLAGAGVAAAGDWLPVLRTEHVAVVPVATADLASVPDLSAYGDFAVTGDTQPRPVADAAAAEAQSGLAVPEVADLPSGVSGEPAYVVAGPVTATFTFSAARAAQAAAAAGEQLPPVPDGLDGTVVRITAGPGAAAVWSRPSGLPALVVGRVTAPAVDSQGARFEVLRDYLLSVPGFPPELAQQLKAVTLDGSTLPLPVPADYVQSSAVDVGGHQATLLTSREESVSGVVWAQGGVLTAVAGTLSSDDVLAVARGLR